MLNGDLSNNWQQRYAFVWEDCLAALPAEKAGRAARLERRGKHELALGLWEPIEPARRLVNDWAPSRPVAAHGVVSHGAPTATRRRGVAGDRSLQGAGDGKPPANLPGGSLPTAVVEEAVQEALRALWKGRSRHGGQDSDPGCREGLAGAHE